MVSITFLTEDGESVDVKADPGMTLMEAALGAGVDGILAECGGGCSCATCHIILDEAWFRKLGEANPLEMGMLEVQDKATDRSRLSCQIDVTEEMDGMVVRVGGC